MSWKERFAEGERLPSLAGEVTFEASVLTVDGAGFDDAGTPRERAARLRTLRAAVNIQPPRVAIVIDGQHLLLCTGASGGGGGAGEQLRVAASLPLAPGSMSIELADDVAVLRVFAAALEDEFWHTHETLVLRAATGGAAATARLMDALVARGGEGGSGASETSAAAAAAPSAARAQALPAPLALQELDDDGDDDDDDAAASSPPEALDSGAEVFAEGGDLAARVRDAVELVGGVDAVASLLTISREASAAAADAAEARAARKGTHAGRNRRALLAAEQSTVRGARLDASPLRAAIVYLSREELVLNRVEASTKLRDAAAAATSAAATATATAAEAQQQQRAHDGEIRRALARLQTLEERVTHARKVQVPPVAPAPRANSAQKREARKKAAWRLWKQRQLSINGVARASRALLYADMRPDESAVLLPATAALAARYVRAFEVHDDARAYRSAAIRLRAESAALDHTAAAAKGVIGEFQAAFARAREEGALDALREQREPMEASAAAIASQLEPDVVRGSGARALVAVRNAHRARTRDAVAALEDEFTVTADALRLRYDVGFSGLLDELAGAAAAASEQSSRLNDAFVRMNESIFREQVRCCDDVTSSSLFFSRWNSRPLRARPAPPPCALALLTCTHDSFHAARAVCALQSVAHALFPAVSAVHTERGNGVHEVAELQHALRSRWAAGAAEDAIAFLNKVSRFVFVCALSPALCSFAPSSGLCFCSLSRARTNLGRAVVHTATLAPFVLLPTHAPAAGGPRASVRSARPPTLRRTLRERCGARPRSPPPRCDARPRYCAARARQQCCAARSGAPPNEAFVEGDVAVAARGAPQVSDVAGPWRRRVHRAAHGGGGRGRRARPRGGGEGDRARQPPRKHFRWRSRGAHAAAAAAAGPRAYGAQIQRVRRCRSRGGAGGGEQRRRRRRRRRLVCAQHLWRRPLPAETHTRTGRVERSCGGVARKLTEGLNSSIIFFPQRTSSRRLHQIRS
jgi:hypothetical protein